MSEKTTPTLYLFHGDDDLSLEEAIGKLRAGMGENGAFNTSVFDGQTASVPEILNAVSSYPFLSDKRLVIAQGLVAWITRKGAGEPGKAAVAYLKENAPTLPEYARLVLVERGSLSAGNTVLKFVQGLANAYVRHFEVPKDSSGWIVKRAQAAYNAAVEPRAAAALAEVTSGDLRRADNEIAKLVSYVDGARPITEEDVAALTPYVPEANIFRMVDAIVAGKGQVALALLHRLLAEKGQEPIGTFAMIVRQFRLLLLAREHLDAGGTAGELSAVLGVGGYPAQNIGRQARGFSLQQLEDLYRSLQALDAEMKTGRIKPELALETFIVGLAR